MNLLWYSMLIRAGRIPVLPKAGMLLCVLLVLFSCARNEKNRQLWLESKKEWESKILRKDFPTDSILLLLDTSIAMDDDIAVSVLCRELGQRMRESSDFSKAITYHQQGLVAAYKVKDTVGITLALNNIGTDFRRIGALPEASDYHYRALQMAEAFSGRSEPVGRKNRVMAVNGIGNVHLAFNNYDEAETFFREALAEEKALNSPLGQAMNYANIGSIFEKRQMYDSAFIYYQHSLEQNILAKSELGIGLCYIHFGDIYEKLREYDQAEHEYQLAYDIMGNISDTWHWLEACLAIARIRLLKNDFVESKKYIDRAREAATAIQSPQHLAETYGLLHEYHLKRRRFADALNDFKLSKAYQDSVQDVQKLNRVIDMRVNYERDKNRQHIAQLNIRNEMETRQKKIILVASIIIVVLLILLLSALFYAYLHRTKSNKILRNLDRLRSDFFTNVTHEFRTPLTVIMGLSEHMQMQKNITPVETNSYLKAIDRQGKHLMRLVNQLLNMAKVNAGMDHPEWKKGNMVVYTRMVTDSFRLYAENKNIQLSFSSSEPFIEMDFVPHYLDEIMQNLLSNAIKFTPRGGKVGVVISTGKNKEVTLKVTDNGEGIPEEDMGRIFELFFQSAPSDKQTGSGIGLSYIRQLVEIMHGKIEVESELKKGSAFTVTWPLRQSGEQIFPVWNPNDEKKAAIEERPDHRKMSAAFKEQPSSRGTPRSGLRTTVLLIEDSDDVVVYIKAMLPEEYNVISAHDGTEGLELANEIVPDIIISDIMMPDKDGLSLCCDIRESELLNHIPVILLTAKTTLDDQLHGLKCGADAYIRKPFHPDELLIQMKSLLENRRLLKEKYMRAILKGDSCQAKDVNIDFLQKVTDIVYKEMQNPGFTSVYLANELCLSISQLNRKLTAVSGYSPSSYIIKLRIDRAKKKLASEHKLIGQVAAECGFHDVAYFSRIFKKYTGVTPSQYQRFPK